MLSSKRINTGSALPNLRTTDTPSSGVEESECHFFVYHPLLSLYLTHNTSFAEVNHFRWSEEYQALWTETYKTGILVETKAFGSDIKFGTFLHFR